jgi:hypothetical protein
MGLVSFILLNFIKFYFFGLFVGGNFLAFGAILF